ncbi:hypothetical protein LTR85_004400 [Meristemomyces frigidus]|nr:hypothetical protein LTR85_004400 [Meristemomyces frigidus]
MSSPKATEKATEKAMESQAPSAAPSQLARESIARSVAAFERGDKHEDAVTLLKHLETMLLNDRAEAKRMIEVGLGSLPTQRISAEDDIAMAERELTYAVLRMENALKTMPEGPTKQSYQKELKQLKELRAAYAKRHPFAVEATRGTI